MYLLGYDIGSSSVKVALVPVYHGDPVFSAQSPSREMAISSPYPGWAEQAPELWWKHLTEATMILASAHPEEMAKVQAIGISYQMHGLVLVDEKQDVLRPSIIWCDSRAVEIGVEAFEELGKEACMATLLNSPGNFTASKMRWVQENEPHIYARAAWGMLPGDYIAMQLTGKVSTTASGLSEGVLWDFQQETPSGMVLDYHGIDPTMIPEVVPTFGWQGKLLPEVAESLGLPAGIPVSYRAGDQPNNALSLNALEAGEVAGTGGTSGVMYGVVDRPVADPSGRANSFLHVNHQAEAPKIGVLLCINGAGSQYGWLRRVSDSPEGGYAAMSQQSAGVPIGAEGLSVLPYGNGAERMLGNQNPGGRIMGINFNVHRQAHLYRAGLEGIAFSYVLGLQTLRDLGIAPKTLRVDSHNLFQSEVFGQTIANLGEVEIEMLQTNGAIGAARGAGYGAGMYPDLKAAVGQQTILKKYKPMKNEADAYEAAFNTWKFYMREAGLLQGFSHSLDTA